MNGANPTARAIENAAVRQRDFNRPRNTPRFRAVIALRSKQERGCELLSIAGGGSCAAWGCGVSPHERLQIDVNGVNSLVPLVFWNVPRVVLFANLWRVTQPCRDDVKRKPRLREA